MVEAAPINQKHQDRPQNGTIIERQPATAHGKGAIRLQFTAGSASPMAFAHFVLRSLSLVQPPMQIAEDVQVFTRAIREVMAAAQDQVITEKEADAVIGFLAEQFATRRATQALSSVSTSMHSALL